MAVNLLDLARNYLNDGIVSQVSSLLGESQSATQKAFDGALPAILGGLIRKVNEPGGASSIMDMIGEVTAPNRVAGDVITPTGGLVSQLSDLLTNRSQSSSLLSMGASLIQSLFGNKTGAVTSSVSSYSGVDPSSASSIMNLAGPVLLSLLGQKLADEGTGVSGLVPLLSSQMTNVQTALPTGLGSLLGSIPGLSMLGGLTSWSNDVASVSREPLVGTPPVSTPNRPVTPAYTEEDDRSPGNEKRWLPWLLLLLGAAALFYFLRSCNNDKKETVSTPIETTVDTASAMRSTADSIGTGVAAAADSVGETIEELTAKLGAFFKRKLPSGYELNIPELGIENKLIQFIEDKNKPVDKTTWFNFDRLLFDTGKATLRPESQEQVTNMAEILKAYPQVELKLGGYTDNTGGAAVNKKLSQERADAVKAELVKLGSAASRLDAEGYGPEHPVASNDTPEGRAQNRRIAVRVTKK